MNWDRYFDRDRTMSLGDIDSRKLPVQRSGADFLWNGLTGETVSLCGWLLCAWSELGLLSS